MKITYQTDGEWKEIDPWLYDGLLPFWLNEQYPEKLATLFWKHPELNVS